MSKKKRPPVKIEKVFIYTRVSTDDQARQGNSIPAQLERLRAYCAHKGWRIVDEFQEEGESARDDDRPVFKKMMERALAPEREADAIVVMWTSRFMRDTRKARMWKDTLRNRGIAVVASEQETSDDPVGHLMEGLYELLDQFESEMNGMRTRAAMVANAKQGYFNGSRAPFGFVVEKVEVLPGIFKGKLVPEPAEVLAARELVRLYVETGGAKATAAALNKAGLLRRGKRWTKDAVLTVLSEEALVGTYWWGKTGRPREEWIPINVAPIVDAALFDLARKLRQEREPAPEKGRLPSSPMLLAGLVKCGRCGAGYQLMTGKGGSYRYYNCRSYLRVGKNACVGYAIPAAELDDAVLEHLADRLFTRERCSALVEALIEESTASSKHLDVERKALKKELVEVDKKIARWVEQFEAGSALVDLGVNRLAELRERKRHIEETLSKVVPLRAPPAKLTSPKALERFRAAIRSLFLAPDRTLARSYLRFLVEVIKVTENRVEIVAKTDAALQMMAAGAEHEAGQLFTAPPRVLTSDLDWLRHLGSNQGPCD